MSEDRYGLVYFIGHGEVGPIKVGFTGDRDPMSRLRQLQTGTPEDLEVLGTIEAYASIERKIQAFLAPHSIRGEWFEREPALIILNRLKSRSQTRINEFVDHLHCIQLSDQRSISHPEEDDPLHVQIAKDLLRDIADQLRQVNTSLALPFRAWLLTQLDRDDPTGDLAKDVTQDPTFPPTGGLIEYLIYIKSKTTQAAVVRTTIDAWIECDLAADSLATREEDVWDWTKP